MAISLNTLDPRPAKMRVQNKVFGQGLWMALGALAIDLVLPHFLRLEQWLAPAVMIGCIGFGGLLLMLATMRKEEYAVFSNLAGVQILSVGRLGPDARQFDAFREQIITQIEKARAGAGNAA